MLLLLFFKLWDGDKVLVKTLVRERLHIIAGSGGGGGGGVVEGQHLSLVFLLSQ